MARHNRMPALQLNSIREGIRFGSIACGTTERRPVMGLRETYREEEFLLAIASRTTSAEGRSSSDMFARAMSALCCVS